MNRPPINDSIRARLVPSAAACGKAAALLAALLLAAPLQAQPDPGARAELTQALTEAEATLESAPNSLKTLQSAGNAALFLGDYGKAVKYFHHMVEVDPAQDAPNWRLGIAYYFNERYAESAAQFAKYHEYDGRDRENGLWKFLGDAKTGGLEKARGEMLPYKEFDREPFPALYDVYAGKVSPEDFTTRLQQRDLTGDPRVMFFAHYYMGLFEELLDHHDAALAKIDQALALFTPDEANATGPGYMYYVARTHKAWLQTHRGTAKAAE